MREVLGAEPDIGQEKILRAYGRGDRRISARSGHGVGKTTALAWCIIHHALTEAPQKTVCTAPTSAQLFDALRNEVVFWLRKLPKPLLECFEIQSDRIHHVAGPEVSFISFRTSSPEKPEALAGVHSENVLLIADEASGIPEAIFEAAAGSMSTEGATTILAGNPVRDTGLFFDTHHMLRDVWTTIHISCLDAKFVTPDYIEDMARRYGRNSNAFRVRVLGEFPLSGDDAVIPRELVQAALTRDVQPFRVRTVWGLDPARFGSDDTALAVRQGNALLEPVTVWDGLDTMQVVGRVREKYLGLAPSLRPEAIMVDEIGIGAGILDRLRELGLPAFGVNVAEQASLKEQYQRLRDEMWMGDGREWFVKRNCRLWGVDEKGERWQDDRLAEELCAPTFQITSSGKYSVEAKKDMKKRLPRIGSPNRADAFLLSLMHAAGVAGGEGGATSWNKPLAFQLGGMV